MHVILGADHGGYQKKEEIKSWLLDKGFGVVDVGATSIDVDDDYVDFAKEAIAKTVSDEDRIVLFCRNGFGMMIAANRFTGERCGLAFDKEAVARGRTDDDINCLSIPADYVDVESVKEMVMIFLSKEFAKDEKYARRIMKLDNLIK